LPTLLAVSPLVRRKRENLRGSLLGAKQFRFAFQLAQYLVLDVPAVYLKRIVGRIALRDALIFHLKHGTPPPPGAFERLESIGQLIVVAHTHPLGF
jgi:hypothetical protein